MKKFLLIWARTIDHRIGHTDDDKPDIPVLTLREAYASLILRSFLILLNTVTCIAVIASCIKHWNK